jgi:hypothetical protein
MSSIVENTYFDLDRLGKRGKGDQRQLLLPADDN